MGEITILFRLIFKKIASIFALISWKVYNFFMVHTIWFTCQTLVTE